MTHRTSARHASLVVAAMTMLSIPLAAQNPPAPAPAPPAPRAPMACDSACRANQGGMMGQMDHQMPMGQMDHQMPMGQMGQMNTGGMGGMMCPMMATMMGHMGNQGGMMGNMGAMQHGAMGADTAAVRDMAEHHATFTRAYYQALVGKGFTAEQALRIITSQPMPGGR